MTGSISASRDKIAVLLAEKQKTEEAIDDLEGRLWEIAVECCSIAGNCPRCRNTHYPHCGKES